MSDAQKLIREVISKAWAKARDDAYLHGAWNSSPAVDPDEWAAEIDKALGGLTRDWAAAEGGVAVYCHFSEADGDSRQDAVNDLDCYEDSALVSRWVSGWTVTE